MTKEHTFKGKDQYDLDKQLWDWRSANPKVKVTRTGPVKSILEAHTMQRWEPIVPRDTVSMSIQYEE